MALEAGTVTLSSEKLSLTFRLEEPRGPHTAPVGT